MLNDGFQLATVPRLSSCRATPQLLPRRRGPLHTPSSLSVLIRELELQLGFRLFDRTTRHVGVTKYGSELPGVVRHSLERVDATVSRIGRSATQANLSLSVAAPPLIAANVLPEAIKEFRSDPARAGYSRVRCRRRRPHPLGRRRSSGYESRRVL